MARILIVDDEESIRVILRRSLERFGHEISEAPDGAVGLSLFESDPFDLVVTDLFMPNHEGIELILELRERYPEVKILVVSGGIQSPDSSLDRLGPLADGEALGADASIPKPFDIRDVIHTVDELLK